jgi:hypothetical protein
MITRDKDDKRIFYDVDGNPITLYQLVSRETQWAVSRITDLEMQVHDLEIQLENTEKELDCEQERT